METLKNPMPLLFFGVPILLLIVGPTLHTIVLSLC